MEHSRSLPYASSLCGACYDVCPVKINIPEILIHLRERIVDAGHAPAGERWAMKAAGAAFASDRRLHLAQQVARMAQWPFVRNGRLTHLPPPFNAWTDHRAICRRCRRNRFATGGRSANREGMRERARCGSRPDSTRARRPAATANRRLRCDPARLPAQRRARSARAARVVRLAHRALRRRRPSLRRRRDCGDDRDGC